MSRKSFKPGTEYWIKDKVDGVSSGIVIKATDKMVYLEMSNGEVKRKQKNNLYVSLESLKKAHLRKAEYLLRINEGVGLMETAEWFQELFRERPEIIFKSF